jgi:ATP-dependent Clp protease adaptor protein ClpS
MSPDTQRQSREDQHTLLLNEESAIWHLVVWNDEVNTFDWVIESLIEICHHTYEQAEQCALFIHFKGKYAVKHGEIDQLRPMCEALLDRTITATIEEMADA